MSQIDDAINWLNDLDIWAQWCVGITATLLVLGLFRLILKSVILDFVKRTPFEWDDKLYKAVSKRGYIFLSIVGFQTTMKWVHGDGFSWVVSLEPFF